MISKDQFLELKHLKSLGVPTTTIAKKIGISVPNANKWLRLDEEAFENYLRNNTPYLEQYRAFIISILKICPQTPATNIMYRIKDQFPDFNCKKTTFFKYVKDLREQTGYIKPSERPTSFREETPPGYEAQVDFGQFKMKDMYDRNIRVYFFCMVLSYSRMRFVYFSREPFRTKTAVDAHKFAFRYFGGRTQTILYDQDRLFVISEKYGNITLVDCSVIIIDDVMYANIIPEDLPLFYRAVSFLNEERSLIIITNRELSGWINAAEDTHLMQTLVDRITANSQIIRL